MNQIMLKQFWTSQYAQSTFLSAFIEKGIVSFNGFNFHSLCWGKYGAVIKRDNFHDLDNMNLVDYESPFWGGGVISKSYGIKNITMTLTLLTASNADMVTLIDEMKEKLQPIETDLEILINGQYRVYKASCNGVIFPDMNRGTNYLPDVLVTFRITSETWRISEPQSYFFPDVTENQNFNITVNWNKEPYPRFLFINKASGNSLTEIRIRIRKLWENTGNDVYIIGTFTNDDIIEFDYDNSIVKQNDAEIPFNNIMTKLFKGINVIDVEFTGTANIDFYVFYNPTFY